MTTMYVLDQRGQWSETFFDVKQYHDGKQYLFIRRDDATSSNITYYQGYIDKVVSDTNGAVYTIASGFETKVTTGKDLCIHYDGGGTVFKDDVVSKDTMDCEVSIYVPKDIHECVSRGVLKKRLTDLLGVCPPRLMFL